jgi:hypothetical protein
MEKFRLTKGEEKGIREIYVTALTCRASRNDLQLLKDVKKYGKLSQALSKIVMKKFLGHL